MLALAGCAATPEPTPPPAVSVTPAAPEKPLAIARPAPLPRPVDLHWAFSTTPESCTALASGPGGSLQVQTTPSNQILLTAKFTANGRALPPRARQAKLRFTGAAGAWTLPGGWHDREFTSARPLDVRGLAGILGLLGGGTIVVTAGAAHLGAARLPSSSGEGNAWVGCPKQMIAGR